MHDLPAYTRHIIAISVSKLQLEWESAMEFSMHSLISLIGGILDRDDYI